MTNLTQAHYELVNTLLNLARDKQELEALEAREDALEDLVGNHLEECQLCHPLRDPHLVAQCIMDGSNWVEAQAEHGFTQKDLVSELQCLLRIGADVAKYILYN